MNASEFWTDVWTQITSLGKSQWSREVYYEWYTWYDEWKENTCYPGVKYDKQTSPRTYHKDVIQEAGITSRRLPEEYPKGVSVGTKIELERPITYPTNSDPNHPEQAGSKGEPTSQTVEAGTLKTKTPQSEDTGSWTPMTVAAEGYGSVNDLSVYDDANPDTEDPEGIAVRSGAWSLDKKNIPRSSWTPLQVGAIYTGKELKSILRTPYAGQRANLMISDLDDSTRYVYRGASFYSYGGQHAQIENDSGVSIEVTSGYYIMVLGREIDEGK